MTFRHTADFTPADGDFRVAWKRTWLERFCAAQQGAYNYVQVTYTSPEDPSRTFRGGIQVEASGSAKMDEVTCERVDSDAPYNTLQCERAVVDLASPGDAYVVVQLSNLD